MDRDHHPAPRSDNAQAARLRIDLDALAANHAALRREAAGAEVAPVLKADAYGLGAAEVGRRLWAEGARTFFVARLAEGVALRLSLGPARAARIYVLDGCAAGAEGGLHAAALTPVLNSLEQVEAWSRQAAREGRALDAALHIDTGLNRLGLRLEEAEALAAAPDRLRGIELTLVMSHLACADLPGHPLTARQAEALARARRLFSGVPASLASSAGAFQGESLRFDMVRPGISLYGGGPFGRPHPAIRSVAHLAAPLIQARTVPPGETVGYGASFTAPRAMRVGIVAAGYADGLLRSASGDGYGWLHGAPRPYLGRVSMDLIALDLSGCDAQPGDEVELLGEHVNVDDHARAAGTIALEVLTRLGPRLARTYVGAVQA